jgi:hypothetical protein
MFPNNRRNIPSEETLSAVPVTGFLSMTPWITLTAFSATIMAALKARLASFRANATMGGLVCQGDLVTTYCDEAGGDSGMKGLLVRGVRGIMLARNPNNE